MSGTRQAGMRTGVWKGGSIFTKVISSCTVGRDTLPSDLYLMGRLQMRVTHQTICHSNGPHYHPQSQHTRWSGPPLQPLDRDMSMTHTQTMQTCYGRSSPCQGHWLLGYEGLHMSMDMITYTTRQVLINTGQVTNNFLPSSVIIVYTEGSFFRVKWAMWLSGLPPMRRLQ